MQTYVQRKTEQKKQFTVYSSVYVYIYIYIFIFKLLLCFVLFLNHYTLLYFSHVNLQLKVGANEDEVLGILSSCGCSASPPLFHLTWKHGLGEKTWVIAQNKPFRKAPTVSTPFTVFLRAVVGSGQSKRAQCGDQGYQTYDI